MRHYLYTDRSAMKRNRSNRNSPEHPTIIVSDGKGRRRRVFEAQGTAFRMVYDPKHPVDNDAVLWVETDEPLKVRNEAR